MAAPVGQVASSATTAPREDVAPGQTDTAAPPTLPATHLPDAPAKAPSKEAENGTTQEGADRKVASLAANSEPADSRANGGGKLPAASPTMAGALQDKTGPGDGPAVPTPAPAVSAGDAVKDTGAPETGAGGAPTASTATPATSNGGSAIANANGHVATATAAGSEENPSAPKSTPVAADEPQPQGNNKRKATETGPAAGGAADNKKSKTDPDAGKPAATNGGSSAGPRKVGRPKGKRAAPAARAPAGLTARKTRSQGPVEG